MATRTGNDPTQDPVQSVSLDDETLRNIGPDATATFDNSTSNPTGRASSEATNAATAVDEDNDNLEDEFLAGEDDDAAIDEEDDEENEEEDVEDEDNL